MRNVCKNLSASETACGDRHEFSSAIPHFIVENPRAVNDHHADATHVTREIHAIMLQMKQTVARGNIHAHEQTAQTTVAAKGARVWRASELSARAPWLCVSQRSGGV